MSNTGVYYHRLNVGEEIEVIVNAKLRFSVDRLEVMQNELYRFYCDPGQLWKDWMHESSPDGFNNRLANFFGVRVKNVRCFCLCGVFNEAKVGGFQIGSLRDYLTNQVGTISFFANDTWWAYWNNSCEVRVRITRIQ